MRNRAVPQQPANGVVVCRAIPDAWFVVVRCRTFMSAAAVFLRLDSWHHPRPDPAAGASTP